MQMELDEANESQHGSQYMTMSEVSNQWTCGLSGYEPSSLFKELKVC